MATPEYLTFHQPLVADLREWSSALESDYTSQRIRRAFLHCAISYIEAATYGMKQGVATMHDELVGKGMAPIFSLGEMTILREVTGRFDGNAVVEDYVMLSIRANVRFAFQAIKRAFGLDWNPPEGDCWNDLKRAKAVRNNITHPKSAAHLSVSDDDLILVEGAAAWFGETHESLVDALKAKVERVQRGEDVWPHGAP